MKQQDIEDLRQLIEFLKQHGVSEFDVDRGDLKIRLKFNPPESGPASLMFNSTSTARRHSGSSLGPMPKIKSVV